MKRLLALLLLIALASPAWAGCGVEILDSDPDCGPIKIIKKRSLTANEIGLPLDHLAVYFGDTVETPAAGVYKWVNEGSWGGYASQSVEVNKPSYDAANKCWVFTDTIRHTLQTVTWPNYSAPETGTFFIVQKFNSGSYGTSIWTSNTYCRWFYNNVNSFGFSQNSGFTDYVISQTPMSSSIVCHAAVQGVSTTTVYLDGVKKNEAAKPTAGQKSWGATYVWNINGAIPANPYGINGSIYSIVFYNKPMTDAEVANISSLLLKAYKP